jgi:hypothetical protein
MAAVGDDGGELSADAVLFKAKELQQQLQGCATRLPEYFRFGSPSLVTVSLIHLSLACASGATMLVLRAILADPPVQCKDNAAKVCCFRRLVACGCHVSLIGLCYPKLVGNRKL